MGADQNFENVWNYRPYYFANGYGMDPHELQVMADGSYFMVGLLSQTVDMSRYVAGGDPKASVQETSSKSPCLWNLPPLLRSSGFLSRSAP